MNQGDSAVEHLTNCIEIKKDMVHDNALKSWTGFSHCTIRCNVLYYYYTVCCHWTIRLKLSELALKGGRNLEEEEEVLYCWKSNWEIGGNFGNLTKMESQLNNWDYFGNLTKMGSKLKNWEHFRNLTKMKSQQRNSDNVCWGVWDVLEYCDVNFEYDITFLKFVQTNLCSVLLLLVFLLLRISWKIVPFKCSQRNPMVGCVSL